MFWQAEVAVPSRNKHHIVTQVLPLDFGFLENHNVCFENVEHGLINMLVGVRFDSFIDIRLQMSSCLSMADMRTGS